MAERSDTDDDVAERLVRSARQLLLDGGLDAVTVRSVAGGAGMSTMNVYSRFGGKDGILDVLHRESVEILQSKIDAIEHDDLGMYLRTAADTYRDFALDEPARYELMFGGDGRGYKPGDDGIGAARALLSGVVARIDRAVATGEVDLPAGIDGVLLATTLWAMCHGTLAFELDSVAPNSVRGWSAVHDAGVSALIGQFCTRAESFD